MEQTSCSEASCPSPSRAEVMEVTSASESMSEHPNRGRGRGRRGGRGTAASSRNPPKPKAAIHKPRGRRKKASSVRPLPPNPDNGMEATTSESEETRRIAAATKRTQAWSSKGGEATSSDELETAAATSHSQNVPDTSGLFDYATWLMDLLTDTQRQSLTSRFTWMDLCAGLGTPIIVYEALRRALLPFNLSLDGTCTGLTEMNDSRREALRRRTVHAPNDPPIFKSNSELSSRTPKDDRGNIHDIPIAKLLFMGIVCVDISGCTSTPKSLTDQGGATGQCWLAFLDYLDLLTFDERPLAIVLECVDKLNHNRNLAGRVEKGTLVVIEALKERGYVGQWRRVSATNFFLPQRRPRVWGLFLKVRGGMGPKAVKMRERDLEKAFDFIQKSQTQCHEPLQKILSRTPEAYAHRPTQQHGGGQAWRTTQGPNFQAKHGLSDEEVEVGRADFDLATADVLKPRQQAAVWLQLCRLRKTGRIPNWKAGVLVSDCGSSVDWLSVTKDVFPCVRPGCSYLIFEDGKPKRASGPVCLAMQGIGKDEADSFGLLLEEDSLLRQLAGNAFCANICLVFLVAALLHG